MYARHTSVTMVVLMQYSRDLSLEYSQVRFRDAREMNCTSALHKPGTVTRWIHRHLCDEFLSGNIIRVYFERWVTILRISPTYIKLVHAYAPRTK